MGGGCKKWAQEVGSGKKEFENPGQNLKLLLSSCTVLLKMLQVLRDMVRGKVYANVVYNGRNKQKKIKKGRKKKEREQIVPKWGIS